jgi:transcriptional regulator with XRE-family HTH domain
MARTPVPDPALASAIRRLREARGLSRHSLATGAGITYDSLGRIELAHANPSWNTVRNIAGALSASLVELATAVESKELGAPARAK